MKKQTFAKGALALAVCSIIAKGLGGVYRISLTSVLGAEGIGYYQLVFPFFSLVLALLASGVPVTVSRLVSGELSADNTGGVRTLLQRSLAYALAAGLLGGVMTPQYQFFYPWCGGCFRDPKKDRSMIVSRGLGTHSVNLRLNNKPQVVVVKVTSNSIF